MSLSTNLVVCKWCVGGGGGANAGEKKVRERSGRGWRGRGRQADARHSLGINHVDVHGVHHGDPHLLVARGKGRAQVVVGVASGKAKVLALLAALSHEGDNVALIILVVLIDVSENVLGAGHHGHHHVVRGGLAVLVALVRENVVAVVVGLGVAVLASLGGGNLLNLGGPGGVSGRGRGWGGG
jgi:hypothetical protein